MRTGNEVRRSINFVVKLAFATRVRVFVCVCTQERVHWKGQCQESAHMPVIHDGQEAFSPLIPDQVSARVLHTRQVLRSCPN